MRCGVGLREEGSGVWGAVYLVDEEPTQPRHRRHAQCKSRSCSCLRRPTRAKVSRTTLLLASCSIFVSSWPRSARWRKEFLPKLQLFGLEPTSYKELEWVDQDSACGRLSNKSSQPELAGQMRTGDARTFF